MKQFEELFFKISEDFHAELNPILKALDPEIEEHPHYIGKNSLYKLYLVKDLLLNFSKEEVNKSILASLRQVLTTYELKFKKYFENYGIATGYIFYGNCNLKNIKNYFWKLEKYCSQFNYKYKFSSTAIYFLSLDIRGFPADCSLKLRGIMRGENIDIKTHRFPDSEQEVLNGRKMYEIENEDSVHKNFPSEQKELWEQNEKKIIKDFQAFCEKVKTNNEIFFDHFEEINRLIIDLESSNKKPSGWLTDLYEELTEYNYINCTLERFHRIFSPTFSTDGKQKVEWLKSKYLLYYFISSVNEKILKIKAYNKWAENRFYIKGIKENRLATELSKAKSNSKYWESIEKLNQNDPLILFFKE